MRISKVKIHNKKFSLFFPTLLTTPPRMVYFSSSIDTPSRNTKMIKSALVTLVASLTLATNANAQWGYDWQERQILGAEFANTAARGAAQYCYSTGFAGPYAGQFIANTAAATYAQTVNFNANLPYNGGFGCGYPYPTPIYPVYGGGCAPVAPVYGGGYGGGCAPVYGGGYGGGSWGVGIGGGVGQTIYGDNTVTTWGVGVNVGVGGGWGGW
jgi:hypothetical protein